MRLGELNKIKEETLVFCRDPVPRSPVTIAQQLKEKFPSFYKKTPAKNAVSKLRENVLTPLEEDGLLVCYRVGDQVWKKAVALTRTYAARRGRKKPRRLTELYQTNFIYLQEAAFPRIVKLPKPDKEMNLDLVVFLSPFNKTESYSWDVINLLMCASESKTRDWLRLFLYTLPLDYNRIGMLERVLEYGGSYSSLSFPFKPSQDAAKRFLGVMSGIGEEDNK